MKPRRDITLGEMQDECIFRGDNCETIGGDRCKFFELCATMQTIDKGCLTPIMWNLTDPPRFTEAQMALLKALSAIGVERIETLDMAAFRMMDKNERHVSLIRAIGLKENETLDLPELFGKEGTK